jgi:choline dehydrogenase-like flavoprotein
MTPDICVIGSGAGGSTLASDLARRGKRVVLLDVGRRIIAKNDYVRERSDDDGMPRAFKEFEATSPYTSPDDLKLIEGFDDLRSFSAFAQKPVLKTRPNAELFRVLGVGGSTLHFQGCSDRWNAQEFKGTALEKVDLAPWYALAEERLSVHGVKPWHRHPPHQLGLASQRLVTAFERAGIKLNPASLAILSKPDEASGRNGCARLNRCSSGCPTGAKSSYDLAMLAPAEKTHADNLSVITRAQALRLIPSKHTPQKIEAVEYADFSDPLHPEGITRRLEAPAFVVACGPIETPRLLLLSASRTNPDGLGNAHDQVGRGFVEQLDLALTVLFNEPLRSYLGPSMEAMAETEIDGRSCVITLTQEALGLVRPIDYARRMSAHPYGAARVDDVIATYGRAVGILIETGTTRSLDNRIALDPAAHDALGRPAARLTTQHSRADLEYLVKMRKLGLTLVKESGGKVVEQECCYDSPPGGAEMRSTCRMDDDPKLGVVDAQQKIHGCDNVYVCDSSVIPASGPGNPSLTTAALALRLSVHLAGK